MKVIIRFKGGAGSGHHGHQGIPGQRGGSLPGSGGTLDFSGYDVDHRAREWNDAAKYVAQQLDSLIDGPSNLSRASEKALHDYSQKDFYSINRALRRGDKPSTQVKRIDQAIDDSVVKSDVYVYRGFYDNLPTSDFTDLAYSSTSLSKDVAAAFAYGDFSGSSPERVIRIKIPAGSNAYNMASLNRGSGEAKQFEILLPRGSSFKNVGDGEFELVN